MKKSRRDSHEPYVGLSWAIIDSAAFKSLSPAAVWLYIMLQRQFHKQTGMLHLILPFRHVAFKLNIPSFMRAREELISMGFIAVIERGGLFRSPNIYALSDKWRHVSIKLTGDISSGFVVRRWEGGKLVSVWYPKKKARGKTGIKLNLRKVRRQLHPIKSSIQRPGKARNKKGPITC